MSSTEYPVPAPLIAALVTTPLEVVRLSVNPDPPPPVVAIAVPFAYPVPPTRVSIVEAPPALALVIVIVSPLAYPEPAWLTVRFVMFPFPSTVVSNVNPVPLPPVVETLEAELNPPTPPDNVPKFKVETPPRLGLVIVKVSPIR